MNHRPVHCQIVMSMSARSTKSASASHGLARLSSSTPRRMSLIIPSSAKYSRKTGAIVAGASTVGMKMMTLCNVGNLTPECRIAAKVKPRTVSRRKCPPRTQRCVATRPRRPGRPTSRCSCRADRFGRGAEPVPVEGRDVAGVAHRVVEESDDEHEGRQDPRQAVGAKRVPGPPVDPGEPARPSGFVSVVSRRTPGHPGDRRLPPLAWRCRLPPPSEHPATPRSFGVDRGEPR